MIANSDSKTNNQTHIYIYILISNPLRCQMKSCDSAKDPCPRSLLFCRAWWLLEPSLHCGGRRWKRDQYGKTTWEFHTPSFWPKILLLFSILVSQEEGRWSRPKKTGTLISMCADPEISFSPILPQTSDPTGTEITDFNWTINPNRREFVLSGFPMHTNQLTICTPFPKVMHWRRYGICWS